MNSDIIQNDSTTISPTLLNRSSNGIEIFKNNVASKSSLSLNIVAIFFILGVIGNFLALVILSKKKNTKNSKYTLMLRCLTTNNLIGLTGMLIQLILTEYIPVLNGNTFARSNCIARVVWRFFGLSSGCIALVMAAERWMALARPFTYHKHITYNVVKRTIQFLISMATIITFLPLIGFGVYYEETKHKCLRYRDATMFWDMTYAYIFMIFGTLLCTIIVVCNLFVVRVLCFIGYHKSKKSIHYNLVNRERNLNASNSTTLTNTTTASTSTTFTMNLNSNSVNEALISNTDIDNNSRCHSSYHHQNHHHHHHAPSLNSCNAQNTMSSSCSSFGSKREAITRGKSNGSCNGHGSLYHQNSISNTEKNFAKLMTFLSISFVICWMPQMISVPLALMPNRLPNKHWFFTISDILMALHFTFDPYIYVISRTRYSFIRDCIKRLRGGGGGSGSISTNKRKQSDENRLRTNIETLEYGLNS
ncbi:uncharacterized protein LOC129613945 [Condylostylus longicornis]|uniref:uncharacterized protein LOC129613945 n=1 Tax=Condylostylus longicornis TaxID=2530218 RepID=UPI00244E0961|nr:uncharacterized protein LOC129613945 [Condylostylus longicornis]